MSESKTFLFLFIFFSVSFALHVVSPDNAKGWFRSNIYNIRYGRQDGENLNITAPFVYIRSRKTVCNEENIAIYQNKIVMFPSDTTKFISQQVEVVKCIQAGGGLAAVVITPEFYSPGIAFHYRDMYPVSNDTNLFILVVRGGDFSSVITKFQAENGNVNQTFIVNLVADSNIWVEIWNSKYFLYSWLIILPILSMIGIILTTITLTIHLTRMIKSDRGVKGASPATNYILLDLIIEFIGFIIRFVYCIIGPALSTSTITLAAHLYLINICNPLEIMTTLIQGMLFVKWGAFGDLKIHIIKRIQWRMFSLAIFALIIQLIMCYVISLAEIDSFYFVLFNDLFILIILIISSYIFVRFGFRLIRLIHGSDVGKVSVNVQERRQRQKQKAVRWIMIGTMFQFIEIIAFALPASTSFFWSPFGFTFTYFLVFLGFNMNALSNVYAFLPSANVLAVSKKFFSRKQTVSKTLGNVTVPIAFLTPENVFPRKGTQTTKGGETQAAPMLPLPLHQEESKSGQRESN
eukprot:c19733_g1_i1.p1 GENE.c19733_g1_i1~~c19733_g1_i1.p1  ORF type:complete len:519 (+),score=167.37 c19733_g1_i1:58-1614(+)